MIQEHEGEKMEQELKPCPFCGNSVLSFRELETETIVVTCDTCNADGPYWGETDSQSQQDAINQWNTRVQP